MPPPQTYDDDNASWDKYRIHVIKTLGKIDDTLEKLWAAIDEVRSEATGIKIKVAVMSAAFGFAGASIPVVFDCILRWKEMSGK